jgi:cytidylate kinase
MYRALALKAIQGDISFDDENALAELARHSRIKLEPTIGGNRVLVDGRDVTQRLRETDVSEAASRVSVHPKVREWMVARQRELGADGGIVMEGRDMAAELRERDRRDRTRANSPLEAAPDATVLDSTALSEDEVLRRVEELVERKLA